MSACVCDFPTTACAMTKFPMATRRHGLRDFQACLYFRNITYHILYNSNPENWSCPMGWPHSQNKCAICITGTFFFKSVRSLCSPKVQVWSCRWSNRRYLGYALTSNYPPIFVSFYKWSQNVDDISQNLLGVYTRSRSIIYDRSIKLKDKIYLSI